MNPSSQLPRRPSRLSDSLHQQLNLYALAASATGVGMLALAQPTEAKIIYTPTQVVIGYYPGYQLDLNHDGIADFSFDRSGSCSLGACGSALREFPAVGNAALGYRQGGGWGQPLDFALKRGSRIGPSKKFLAAEAWLVAIASTSRGRQSTVGPWANVTNHYLGLQFHIKGKIHYGWARMTVTLSRPEINATLTGYAYETIPNKAIIAGKTKGPDISTVRPATLGRLALGRK